MKRTGPTNPSLQELINELKKESSIQKVRIWNRIANDLEVATRKRRIINISRLSRYTKNNETIVVPGKVLGSGVINHSINVAALSFSESAKTQIEEKGKCMSIRELLKANPKGKDVRIIG